MSHIVRTLRYPQDTGEVVVDIHESGAATFVTTGRAGLSATVLREIADLADAAANQAEQAARR